MYQPFVLYSSCPIIVLYWTVLYCTVLFCYVLNWSYLIRSHSKLVSVEHIGSWPFIWWFRPITFRFSIRLRKSDELVIESKHPYLLCLSSKHKEQGNGLRFNVRNWVTVANCNKLFSHNIQSMINHRIKWRLRDWWIFQNIKIRNNFN